MLMNYIQIFSHIQCGIFIIIQVSFCHIKVFNFLSISVKINLTAIWLYKLESTNTENRAIN